jgi:hypothetical protein
LINDWTIAIRKRVDSMKILVVPQFELTPKALANFSPGFERSENPGLTIKKSRNPERVRLLANPFRVTTPINLLPQGCRQAPTPG